MQVNDVTNTNQCQMHGLAKAQKMQEYEELAAQAQALGITDIPGPGRGAIDQLTMMIEQAQSAQSNGQTAGPSYANMMNTPTVGIGPSPQTSNTIGIG